MSRLIVKNLPAYFTQDSLHSHFLSKDGPGGTLTDVKVLQKPDGTSRRFGFVGYKTEAEAQKAQKWFDKTFIHSSRISVSVVDGAKDAPAPRPNKRQRTGPSPSEHTGGKGDEVKKQDAKDAQLEEFLGVMKSRAKHGPSWKDGVAEDSQQLAKPSKSTSAMSDVEMEDVSEDQTAQQAPASDLDWLKQHTKSSLNEGSTAVDEPAAQGAAPSKTPEDDASSSILQSGRLFLRNLAFACTEEEIQELFAPYGHIAQVHIPLDPVTKSPKGVAYVTFADPSNAVTAYKALDKKSFQGRLLHILPAVDRKGKTGDQSGKPKTVKEDKEAKRKAMAGKAFNWAMLYMNSDAVLSSVADRMNLSKADILSPESGNAAVKLALAETHVIQETKSFLEANGVVLSSLSGERIARSDTIILVKNIPYGTSTDQIRELFEPYGQLQRVLVPPAGTMAVVEFVHPDESRKAFHAVAYRRLGDSVIYLEKGPVGMFAEGGSGPSPTTPITIAGVKPVVIEDAPAGTEEPSLAAGTTLFVKNLSFATTTERFSNVFRNLPDFSFARVQTKPDPKRPASENARLSMGYGFVGFKNADAAKKAMKSMQGFVLDGHALVVKFAGRGADEEDGKDGKKVKSHTTKMIVKNVPFEATKKDIRELFGSHGQLKSVRLPKKFDHRSRGFAFLEFVTRHEAENAYAALKHTHLLGRHLVLDWVEDDSTTDIDELRKKAGVGFGGGKEMPGRKRKLNLGDDSAVAVDEDLL